MAQVVNVEPRGLVQAAATVAQHMETAAKPPTSAAPVAAAASPADVAASGAAGAIQTKMAALSSELAPKGPQIQQAAAAAAASLQAQDAKNASRISAVRTDPSSERRPRTHKPQIQAVDVHTYKQDPPPPPPPPDPVSKLHLPNYNPGTLSPEETRTVYAQGELRMRDLNDQLAKQGVSAEERAKILFDQRNSLRSWTRTLMSDRALADQLNATDPNLTWDQLIAKLQARGLSGDDLYNALIQSATRSRPSVNDALGIDPEHPPPLPPIHPLPPPTGTGPGTAPIISPPPDLPPIGQHTPAPPVPPTVLDHPPSTAPPPTVLKHPPLPPWLQDPSPPGFQVSPNQEPPIFGWDMPDPPPLSPPAPAPMPPPSGPPITIPQPPPVSPHDAAAGGVLAGAAAIGAWILSHLAHPLSR